MFLCVYLCASHACSFLFCLIVFKKRMKESVKLESKGGGWYLGEDEGGQTVIRTEYMKKKIKSTPLLLRSQMNLRLL